MKMTDEYGLTGLGFSIVITSILAAVIGVILGLATMADRSACHTLGQGTGVTTEWRGMIAGCYVTDNGETYPLDKWNVIRTR